MTIAVNASVPHESAVPALRMSVTASEIGLVLALLVAGIWPVYAMGCLIIAGIAGWSAYLSHRQVELFTKYRAYETKDLNFKLRPSDIPLDPTGKLLYIGEGYQVQAKHAKHFHERLDTLVPTLEEMTGGFRRDYMAAGILDLRSVYMDPSIFSQHVYLGGATGSGKTRSLDVFFCSAIRLGYSIIWVDPKGDYQGTNLLASLARMYDKPFYWFSMAHPDKSHTYNPFKGSKPLQLISQIETMVPESKEPFWQKAPAAAAANAAACHEHLADFLLAIKGDGTIIDINDDVDMDRIPQLYVALGRAMVLADEAGLSEPTPEMVRMAWEQARGDDGVVDRERESLRIFTTGFHELSIEKFYEEGAANPRKILGYIAKVLFPHKMLGIDPDHLEEYEEQKTKEDRKKAADPASVPDFHVDLAGIIRSPLPWHATDTPDWVKELWAPVILNETVRNLAEHHVGYLKERIDNLISWCKTPVADRIKYCSSLQIACAAFMNRGRIVSAKNPDINIGKIMRQPSVLVMSMDSMSDRASADAFQKLIISNLLGQAGRINANAEKKVKCLLVVDETSCVACQPLRVMLTQARSTGLGVFLCTQERPGLVQAMGGQDGVDSLLNNCMTKLQMLSNDNDEAEWASKNFLSVRIREMATDTTITHGVGQSGHKDIAGFSVSEAHRGQMVDVPLAPTKAIKQMPVGHGFLQYKGATFMVAMPQIEIPPEFAVDWFQEKGVKPRVAA